MSNDSINYTHPDRKLGILCMKYFAGARGMNRLLNEASLPEFIMKITREWENYFNLTCRPSRGVYKHRTNTNTGMILGKGKCLRSWYPDKNKTYTNSM